MQGRDFFIDFGVDIVKPQNVLNALLQNSFVVGDIPGILLEFLDAVVNGMARICHHKGH